MLVHVCLSELRGLSGLTAPLHFRSGHGGNVWNWADQATVLWAKGRNCSPIVVLLSRGRGSQLNIFL